MPVIHALRTAGLILVLASMTLLPGTWTLFNTSTDGMDWRFGNGTTQRAYETRFERSFPHSKTIAQGWAALKLYLLGEVADGAVMGRDGLLFTAEEFKVPVEGADLRAEVEHAIAILRPKGVELVPVLVPGKARMLADALDYRRSMPFENRYDKSLAVFRSYGLKPVDLRPALSKNGSFLITDTHWSPEGARRSAMAIAEHLRGHLDAGEGFATHSAGTAEFDGDLVAFADTGRWRSTTGPVQETIASYETVQSDVALDDGGGLFGDVAIPVVLVGTSFSAKSDFHFDGFLKSALQSDVLNLARIGQGPFAPMRDYLENFAQEDLPPTVVLWEIPERYITPF